MGWKLMEAFIATFVLIFFSEIVDKTQLVILGIAMEYKSPLKVFMGALSAHAMMDGIAIILGAYIGFSVPQNLVKLSIGILFIILGLWSLAKMHFKKGKNKEDKVRSKDPLMASFLTVLISEFGDKTQITSGLLAAKYQIPIIVFVATVAGLALAVGLNVLIGSKISERLSRRTIKMGTAILFILFGAFTLMF
ncbi:MAG: TMEM165/GDT1 family protein [Candidatus Hydrothermarchaeales archaeon]